MPATVKVRNEFPVDTVRDQVTESTKNVSLVTLSVVALLGLLVSVLYWEIFQGLASDWWNDANYSHGMVVPLFSGFLVWQKWATISKCPLESSWLGLLVLSAGIGLLVLGELAAEEFLMRGSFIVVLAGLVLFHCGRRVVRELAFPLVFLFFMVPLPALLLNAVAFPLQGLAAQNATWMLDTLGIPVLRDGNVIHLSEITLGVTEACSGIRSLISLLALAVAWAHLTLPGFGARALFVCSAIPITILANAGRVVLTGLIGLWFGSQYAEGAYHSFSGWVIFLLAFACLLGTHRLILLTRRSV